MAKTQIVRSLVVQSVVVALVLLPRPAAAQLDPLLFLKNAPPNVLVLVDTSARMRLDADGNYYDPVEYKAQVNKSWEVTIGVTDTMTKYRRKIANFVNTSNNTKNLTGTTTNIAATGDTDALYAYFAAKTKLALARAAITQVINENSGVARFGLIKTRQSSPTFATLTGNMTLSNSDVNQQKPSENGPAGSWDTTIATVAADNGSLGATAPLVQSDASGANSTVLSILSKGVLDSGNPGPLIPAGNDTQSKVDSPVNFMLQDAKTEATRLIAADALCANTVVVLVVGGGEGSGTSATNNPATTATQFLNVSGRRVPIYVVAIAPAAADVAQLQSIASNSGGQYFEVTKTMIDTAYTSWRAGVPSGNLAGKPAGTVVVPEFVKALNTAVQHAFERYAQFNTAPTVSLPFGPYSEFQVTSPIVGTFDLTNAKDINGAALPNTSIKDKSGALIPQRSNLMVTTAFSLPGFDGRLRGFRVYKPVVDATSSTGYKFVADGTPLWVACAPGAPPPGISGSPCAAMSTASRNLYTILPDGSSLAFTTANAAALASHLNVSAADASALIAYVRALPIGAIVDSTPAILNAPSLDPPPDGDYAGFANANKNRRALVLVGTNRGMLEAIDARLGVEVWGLIPYNLLAKLKTLRDGQSVGSFDFFVDASAKVADVKVGGSWKTYVFFGQGPGGTFYQTLDATLDGMATSVPPTSDDASAVLSYFSTADRIAFKWSFPSYGSFDPTISTTLMPYGDLKASATAAELSVGQTWSDPSIGQVQAPPSPYVMMIGSGFMPRGVENQANRNGTAAGTTFYMLKVDTGAVLASYNVGNDNKGENVDNCVTAGDCSKQKNALQSDPVAAGPAGSRFITNAYLGDLDGRIWRFDLGLTGLNVPTLLGDPTKLYDDNSTQPFFNGMAAIDVGGVQRFIFAGTGGDLLPGTGVSDQYKLLGILDQGSSGSVTFSRALTKVDNAGDDEKVTSFPAVAGDVVFFTTTTFRPATPCTLPDANLYALTFIGGPAYDNTGDNVVTAADTPKVLTVTGVRATAPFVVDQHLVFGTGERLQLLGDPQDFNNGVGQAGVRILSWREVR